METLLKSDSKPIDLFDTSFATIQSQFFSSNFLLEFLSKFIVSAANPITSLGLNKLFFDV